MSPVSANRDASGMWYQSESARPIPPAMPVSVGIAQPANTAATTMPTTQSP